MNYTYTVKVVNRETQEIVKIYKDVDGLRKANKLKSGLEINMSDDYYVSISKSD